MALLNNAWATRQNYLRGIWELMLFLDKRPEDCTVDELKAYLVHALDAIQQQLLKRAQRKELAKKRLFQHRSDQCPCCLKGQMIMIGIRPPNKDRPGKSNQLLKIV